MNKPDQALSLQLGLNLGAMVMKYLIFLLFKTFIIIVNGFSVVRTHTYTYMCIQKCNSTNMNKGWPLIRVGRIAILDTHVCVCVCTYDQEMITTICY